MEVPTVVTPTRRPQPLSRAPATTTVITAEDIRRSWATNIPDLLRSVPGLDFMRTTASEVNVAARGLNTRLAHRMQLFIDGRSVNEDFFNVLFWHELPITLREIERIEIVRGPVSSLFDAVAFSGMIHIITKSPEQLEGTHAYQAVGDPGTYISNVIHAGVEGKWAYKGSFEYARTNQFPNPDINQTSSMKGREDYKGNGFVEYRFSERSRLSLSAGIDNFERNFDPGLGNNLARIDGEGNRGYVKLSYSFGDFKVQSVWDHLDMDFASKQFPEDGFVTGDAFDLDIQHVMKLGDQNVLTGGAGYRFTRFDSPFLIGPEQKQNFFSAFLQNEYSPLENLTFTAGLQLYTHPEAGVHVSPRASVVYAPWENHTFRASVARAFRNPTILENFVDFDVLAPPCPPVEVKGDTDLKSEAMTSVEFGYQTFLFQRLKARIDFFYNELDDLVLGPSPVGPGPCPAELALSTGGGGTIIGGELAFEFLITDWLKGSANYSYQNRDFADTRLLGMGARNKGNVGIHLNLPGGFRADAYVNIVGESTGFPEPIGPYTMVHLHLGYDFELTNVKGRLGFAGFNLFNDRHREVPGGDIIDRRLTGFLELRF